MRSRLNRLTVHNQVFALVDPFVFFPVQLHAPRASEERLALLDLLPPRYPRIRAEQGKKALISSDHFAGIVAAECRTGIDDSLEVNLDVVLINKFPVPCKSLVTGQLCKGFGDK